MRKDFWRWAGFLFLFSSIAISTSLVRAGEVDILVKKLVEKGVLTKQDADSILEEVKQEAARQEKEQGQKAAGTTGEIPEWIRNTKFGGDLRLRYQYQEREDNNAIEDRARFRLRAAAETKIVDQFKVGFGLTTGGDDPRSGTETFQDTFSKKSVRIDYAFAEYTPANWLSVVGGKFYNPLYRPSDLIWDGDITPEGLAAKFKHQFSPTLDFYFNTALYLLDEKSSARDPYMVAFQPGLIWKLTDNVNFQFAVAYYWFDHVQNSSLDFSAGTNTTSNGKLVFDYTAPVLSGELGFKNPYSLRFVPYFSLFGEYVYNPDPDNDNRGYLAGFTVGHSDMKKFGDWRFEWSYRYLERDAWLDTFPDSDFYSGSTNVQGMEYILNFALYRNIWLALDYYHTAKILGLDQTEDLFQVDLNLKF
jgi:polyhydroxyalkanoate synthesis regulator phasin